MIGSGGKLATYVGTQVLKWNWFEVLNSLLFLYQSPKTSPRLTKSIEWSRWTWWQREKANSPGQERISDRILQCHQCRLMNAAGVLCKYTRDTFCEKCTIPAWWWIWHAVFGWKNRWQMLNILGESRVQLKFNFKRTCEYSHNAFDSFSDRRTKKQPNEGYWLVEKNLHLERNTNYRVSIAWVLRGIDRPAEVHFQETIDWKCEVNRLDKRSKLSYNTCCAIMCVEGTQHA